MSYDIHLKNKNIDEIILMRIPRYIRGGTVPARINPVTGLLEQAEQIEASINITYNYARYYYEATEGDSRFAHDEISAYYADGTTGPIKTEYGIRGLYGKTAGESISMLNDMIKRIEEKYKDENGEWLKTERTRIRYFKDGIECENPFSDILKGIEFEKREDKYLVSEGDTSSYWESTAANAIEALHKMFIMAAEHLLDADIVWDGD